ncbi:MAG: tRNA (N6-threonylcarbamoyladenosine(37)-N6)-methyltransferase TrmO [Desulfobulbaceae bacterium]|jgi:tRNA-Thr(GGU) m(6)t(6)A37 methyltransferase TsaA|nr:tRNA (N6-threonylcarbamoyladenosine(37)-N6)-methyltransferase TrmO [Desulfobulbaceae bacterium]
MLNAIGVIHSPFREKFGIPRQPGLAPSAVGEAVLVPPFDREEMLDGLGDFSHIWLVFLFHAAVACGWRARVRPPRLGGQEKVGVFASRSPHRPNHIGMSAARFLGVSRRAEGLALRVSGLDILDGSPLLDIKPYVPYSDRVTAATEGFAPTPKPALDVRMDNETDQFCRDYAGETGRNLRQLLVECLACDPRPASQRDEREFGMRLWDVNIRFRVRGRTAEALSCANITDRPADQSDS